jgi:tetratricopeptide (TPR) repeat protein
MICTAKTIGTALLRPLTALFRKIAKSAHFNRGNEHFRKGDYDRAIGSHSKAIRLAPRYVPALNNQAAPFLPLGEVTQAIAGFDAALGIDTQTPSHCTDAVAPNGNWAIWRPARPILLPRRRLTPPPRNSSAAMSWNEKY